MLTVALMASLWSISDLGAEIEIIVDTNGNPWFKRAHVGKFLDLPQIYKSLEELDEREMLTRPDIETDQSNSLVKFKEFDRDGKFVQPRVFLFG